MAHLPQNPSTPSLFSSRLTSSARNDTEWERIMVQITFAFMIILGYLISVGMSEAQNLASESERQRLQNQALQSIVSDLRSTDLGRERAERIRIEKENQLERLLRVWSEVCTARRLYRNLRTFQSTKFIPLADDLKCLPISSEFQELNEDIERVFLSGSQTVSFAEIESLMKRVLMGAGFDPEAGQDREQLPPEAEELYAGPRSPAEAALRQLKLQIVDDLQRERQDVVAMQYALVGKITLARIEKLVDLPVDYDVETDIDSDAADLGLRTLNQILNDLHQEMKLLPEAMDTIRGTNESDVNTD